MEEMRTQQTKPKIILIMAYELGYEAVGAYGGTSNSPPVLDELAYQSIRFNYSSAPKLVSISKTEKMGELDNQSTVANSILREAILVVDNKQVAHRLVN
tara:strand:+ start:290 stop:586 length:297 start_codon:yes stop_codon:yes gene_type:complete